MRNKINSLESLRGIAALSVVLYHFDTESAFNNLFTQNGWLMVDFFFVLSGFVITLTYSHRLNTAPQYFEFSKRRLLRLYPLHIVTLTGFICFELAKYVASHYFGINASTPPFQGDKTIDALLPHLLLIHNFVLEDLTWNRPSWSISAEFVTYLIFGGLMLLTTHKSILRAIGVVTIIISAQMTLQVSGMGTSNIDGPARCFFAFFIGYLTCKLFMKDNSALNANVAFALLVSSIAVTMYEDLLHDSLRPVISLIYAATIYAVARSRPESYLIRVLEMKPLVYLGTISFGVYLWHMLVMYVANTIIQLTMRESVEFVRDTPNGMVLKFDNPAMANLSVIAVVLTSILLATLSYYIFEKRIAQYGRNSTNKQ
ncbi:MAG: acyltransferase family protein [Pontibacterium sp.]